MSRRTALQEDSNPNREKQQEKKRQWRFQDKKHRKIKPDTMRIGVAQNVRWPARGAEREPKQTAQVLPQRHEQPPQQRRRGKVRNNVERVRRLVPGQDKINNVHEQRGPKRSLGHVAPRTAPPGAQGYLIRWLLRDAAPTQAQN